MLKSGKMSSLHILSNKLYCRRGEQRPRFRNHKKVGTHLDVVSLKRLRNLSLVNVKTKKMPQDLQINSLTIESSYIENDQTHHFFDKVNINSMTLENSDIDSIVNLGLFQSENNIESLREQSNYIYIFLKSNVKWEYETFHWF